MHLKQVISVVVILPLFFLYIIKLPPIFFLILLAAISVAAQTEFHSMYKAKGLIPLLGIIGGSIFLLSSYLLLPPHGEPLDAHFVFFHHFILMLLFMILSSVRLFSVHDPSSALRDISPVITGFLYVPTLLLAQWYLRLHGYEWAVFLYGCVWVSDMLACVVGTKIGKRMLYRKVSPRKTVEGAFGSITGSILASLLLGSLMFDEIEIPTLILIGGAIGVAVIAGDLVESMFKRDAGVKDSSAIIPGHGGILDKIDGVLFAGPILCLLIIVVL